MAGLARAAGPLDAARDLVARQNLGVALLPMGLAAPLLSQYVADVLLGAQKRASGG